MKIIDRYLSIHYLKTLLFVITFLTTLFIVLDLFNNLNEFLRHGVTLKIVLSYYAFMMPSMLYQLAPAACLMALLYSLGNLHKNHEIIALKTGGLNNFSILAPYLFIGLVISVLLFSANDALIPKTKMTSQSIMDGLILKGKKNLKERSISNLTYYGQDHRMIFAREYEFSTQSLYDVVIFEDNPSQPIQIKITAKKARYEDGRWVFYDCLKQALNRRGDLEDEPDFSSKVVIDLPEEPNDFLQEASQAEYMNSRELKNYIRQLKSTSHRVAKRLWIDFYYRTAFSFTVVVVMLLGAPLATRGIRQSAATGIGTGLGIIALYYVIESIGLALGKGGVLPPVISAWLANLILAGWGLYALKRSN